MYAKVAGCLFGHAIGDALGAPVEFLDVDDIVARFGPEGPSEPYGSPARVTDDTQMSLAVGEALVDAAETGAIDKAAFEPALTAAFVAWCKSEQNDRAPGMTCLKACWRLADGVRWRDATVESSKGCGANMRVAPVGLLSSARAGVTVETRSALAQFQAAFTHGHATALASSDLTAAAVADLSSGGEPLGLAERLRAYAVSQRSVYHAHWLEDLWMRPYLVDDVESGPAEFIARGWDDCLRALERVEAASARADRDSDPCDATGLGWVAEEAFATGLLCFLLYPDDPVAAVRRAALTSGDSDSIACLAGAFAGAHAGLDAWPRDWIERIEYRARIDALAQFLADG